MMAVAHWDERTGVITMLDDSEARALRERVARLEAALKALTLDYFDAWTASFSGSYWQCTYCQAHSADLDNEPRADDHAPDCPWLVAREALGAG